MRLPMKHGIAFVIMLALSLSFSGCRSHTAYVYSAVDPAYTVEKTDPVWLTLPEEPTIRERQLFVVLKSELQKNSFTVVEDKNLSKYVLALSAERKTYDYGTTSDTVVISAPKSTSINSGIVTTSTQRNLVDKTTIYLYLFNVDDFNNGKMLSIWEGSVGATQNVFNVYKTAMFKNLLDVYGRNYEKPTRLSRDYIKTNQ